MTPLRAMPVLHVSDMARSMAVCKQLGFCGLSSFDKETKDIVFVKTQSSDVELRYAEFSEHGFAPAKIRHRRYYGHDDFCITNPDRQIIAFGQSKRPVAGPGQSKKRGNG